MSEQSDILMGMKKLIALAVLALASFVATSAVADPPPPDCTVILCGPFGN